MEPAELPQYADYSLALEGFIWEYYGERLFSLFDLSQPERWEQFRRFLREYYELTDDDLISWDLQLWGIPPWQVC